MFSALHAAADAVEHRALDVLGVDAPVGADALGQLQREPAAGGAEFGDLRSLRDPERVHDLIGLLPLLAVRRFEQPEILGAEQTRVRLLLVG